MKSKRVLTGLKPTGEIQFGNYLGSVKQITALQEQGHEIFLMIADLHAQTVPYDPAELRRLTLDLGGSLIALGVDPKRVVLFRQADVPAHLYLAWILGCLAPTGDLMRMHEFKEQAERYQRQGVGAGILIYPVLMASDILLYQADLVPVGQDQAQHVELTRELARRFNSRFGQVLKVPELRVQPETAKIMSLDNPAKKMSKSLPAGNVEVFATEAEIRQKFAQAVTDSGREVRYDPAAKPAVSNLMTILKYLTEKDYKAIEREFMGQGYAEFKRAIADAFLLHFKAARAAKAKLTKSKIEAIFAAGARKANKAANETLAIVLKKTGLR